MDSDTLPKIYLKLADTFSPKDKTHCPKKPMIVSPPGFCC